MVTRFDNPNSLVSLDRETTDPYLRADALPSDTSNTVVKNAIRLHLDFTNILLLILCIIHLLRNESHQGNELSDVLFLSEQNATVDGFCHLPAQILACDVVSSKVLPCENATQSSFLRRRREASEMACHSCQRLGADIESELVAEVKAQYRRTRFTDCAMCPWVGRVGSSLRG